MANIPVTITAPAAGATVGGSPTLTWTLPGGTRQSLIQVGAYRAGDRSTAPLSQAAPPPFDYVPVAASGNPIFPYGVVPDPEPVRTAVQSFTFDGAWPSTGALPNGAHILWLHIISETLNDDNEVISRDNGVASVRVTVATSLAEEPRRLRRRREDGVPPPAPTIVSPVTDHPFASGAVEVTVQMPNRVVPSELKAAVYDTRWWDFDSNESDNRRPVAFTDRDEDGSATGAEWVPIEEFPRTLVSGVPTWTLTFGQGALPALVPNGTHIVAVRYNTEVTARITSFDPRTGLVRVEHRFDKSRAAIRQFQVTGSTDLEDEPDIVSYRPTINPSVTWPRRSTRNEVGEALNLIWHYNQRNGVGQKSVQVRRILAGGSNAGTRYLSRSSSGVYSWVTALGTGTDIPIRTEHLVLPAGSTAATGWGGLPWGIHRFSVRPTSQEDTQGDWSEHLPVDVYRRLTITSLTASTVGGFIRAAWTHDGATGNNQQRRYRVQVFDSNRRFVTGTSDRPEEPFRARAVLGSGTSFTFNRTGENSLGPVPNGTYTVVLTLWDAYGNRSEERSTSVTVTNIAPAAVTVTPRVYNHLDQVQTGADGRQDRGLIAGDYVGVAFGSVSGLHAVRLERRDFTRSDGRDLQDEAQQVAYLPLGAATALRRWNDDLVDDQVEYQYRAVSIAPSGAETEGAWTPA